MNRPPSLTDAASVATLMPTVKKKRGTGSHFDVERVVLKAVSLTRLEVIGVIGQKVCKGELATNLRWETYR